MSYCVNCGVELDKTAKQCPLCNTPVLNPTQPIDNKSPKPFPTQQGQVDTIKHTDTAVLLSVVLTSTSIACGLLNATVFQQNLWSLYIIGACIILWIFFIPAFIYTKLPIYITVFLDGIAVAFYVGIIAYQFNGRKWYLELAIPIISLLTLLVLIYVFYIRHFSTSILSKAVIIFGSIGILNVGIDLLIHHFIETVFRISWSAIVLTCVVIIIASLLTIITRSRLREAVRRRMHI